MDQMHKGGVTIAVHMGPVNDKPVRKFICDELECDGQEGDEVELKLKGTIARVMPDGKRMIEVEEAESEGYNGEENTSEEPMAEEPQPAKPKTVIAAVKRKFGVAG